MNKSPDEALEQYKIQCRKSGMSEEEVEQKAATMKELLSDEAPDRILSNEELQGLIDALIKRKSLVRSVTYMAATALIGAIVMGPLFCLLSVSLKFLLFAIILIPGIIAGIGIATYYKSSVAHKASCAALSLLVVFPMYFTYDLTSAIAEFGLTKTLEVVGAKFFHILQLSFANTVHNEYVVGGSLIMAALSFHICNGKIDNGDIRMQAKKDGLGNVGFQWPNKAITV